MNWNKIGSALKIFGLLYLISYLSSSMLSMDIDLSTANVAVIPVYGEITVASASSFTSSGVTSDDIVELLTKADNNPKIKAIILDINSPGGSGVAADEIGQKLKLIEKPKIAVIRDVGASAAYWIASACDQVFANRLSLTGSIGVYGSYLDFSGFLGDYNVTYQRYVSGELKDMGSPFKTPSEYEKEVYQKLIDDMEKIFIDEVVLNRNLTKENVQNIATGQVYLGQDALDLGLVDYLGTKEDAVLYLENTLNVSVQLEQYQKEKSFFDIFAGLSFLPKIGTFINPLVPNPTLR